jgi:hypothetical protein
MGIRKDAGEILIFVYNEYTQDAHKIIVPTLVKNTTKWESKRINQAITYLEDLGALKIDNYIGMVEGVHNFRIRGMYPFGIHMIEEESEFKENFGFQIGVPGVFQFSWGTN